jgi:hypothetical protein
MPVIPGGFGSRITPKTECENAVERYFQPFTGGVAPRGLDRPPPPTTFRCIGWPREVPVGVTVTLGRRGCCRPGQSPLSPRGNRLAGALPILGVIRPVA